ncbi:MAG: hypothetical protein HYT78_14515 [Deltaproteobacteria bacterium]|nr:hypothetical protein [Deltaproteobacteria bacterium]
MTQKQRESVAKYLYDVSKLSYTGLVLYGFLKEGGPRLIAVIIGVLVGSLAFLMAYLLEGER